MFMKKRLFTPGPTPIPKKVALVMAEPIIHHRNPEFVAILKTTFENMQYVYQTKQPVLLLTSSGTGSMEAAVTNFLSVGDVAIYVNAGKFGQRWGNILKAYNCKPVEVHKEWGTAATVDDILEKLKENPTAKAVYITHSETSTGVATDVKAITKAVHENSNAVVIVDGITAVGCMEMRFDEWDMDCVVTGSQKGLMIPPGLSCIALGERVIKMMETSNLPKFYFSLKKEYNSWQKTDTTWTPAVSLFIGINEALKMIRAEGIENVWKRHEKLSRACREGCKAMGLKLFGNSPSFAVTAVQVPDGVVFTDFNKILKGKYGITIAGGQDHLKGKIFRLSHLGYYDEFDMVTLISALEISFKELGWKFDIGAGVAATQKFLCE
jgi:aspartate aminotransferase-like enzyme